MLAETDVGRIVTAAQSGANFQYSLLLMQTVLVPILYISQELTVRIWIVSRKHGRKGHGVLICERSVIRLLVCHAECGDHGGVLCWSAGDGNERHRRSIPNDRSEQVR